MRRYTITVFTRETSGDRKLITFGPVFEEDIGGDPKDMDFLAFTKCLICCAESLAVLIAEKTSCLGHLEGHTRLLEIYRKLLSSPILPMFAPSERRYTVPLTMDPQGTHMIVLASADHQGDVPDGPPPIAYHHIPATGSSGQNSGPAGVD